MTRRRPGPASGPGRPMRRGRTEVRGTSTGAPSGTAKALAMAGLLLIAACGGDDGPDAVSATPGASAADTTVSSATSEGSTGVATSDVASELVAAEAPDVDLTSFELLADLDEIWASTGDRTVCSPAEPATALVEFAPIAEPELPVAADDLVVAMLWWETPQGELRRQVLVLDDGAWSGPFGPARARRAMDDTPVELTAVGFDAEALARLGLDDDAIEAIVEAVADRSDDSTDSTDSTGAAAEPTDDATAAARAALDDLGAALVSDAGDAGDVTMADVVATATFAAEATVTVLAPTPCGDGQTRDRRGRSRTDAELTVELSADASDGVEVWATSDTACSNGPTTVDLVVTTTGRPTGVRAQWTLPTGATGAATLRRGDTTDGVATWQARLGPFQAPRSMPEVAELPVSVTARDADGDEATASTVMVVRRPVACGSAGPTATDGTGDGAAASTVPGDASASEDAASVTGSLASREIWATADGRCPAGATSVRVDARTTGPVASVDVRVLRAGGAVVTTATLTSSTAGRWSGTIGPIPAAASMPESSTLTVQFGARGDGRTLTDDETITLRRPAACGSESTAVPPTPTPPAPTTPGTPGTPGTTAAPGSTAAPGTTAAESLSITGSVSGGEMWATAAGQCSNGATTLTVEARTTGPAAEVQVRAQLPGGGNLATVTLAANGAGRWRGTLGPIAAQQSMPEAGTVTLQFGVRSAGGGSASDSGSITLRRPVACASAPPTPTTPLVPAPPVTPAPTTPPPPPPPPTPPPTAAPTTAATLPPTTPPVAVTVSGNVNGSQISASANGACPTAATTLAVGARTTGAVTEVQVRVLLPGGAVAQTISLSPNGDGRWSGTIGPIAGAQGMPDTSTLTVQFGARGGGSNVSDSRSVTLLRPPPCG